MLHHCCNRLPSRLSCPFPRLNRQMHQHLTQKHYKSFTKHEQACHKNPSQTETIHTSLKIQFQKKTDFPEYTKNIFSTKLLTSNCIKTYLNTVSRHSSSGKGGNGFGGIEAYPFDATPSGIVLLS